MRLKLFVGRMSVPVRIRAGVGSYLLGESGLGGKRVAARSLGESGNILSSPNLVFGYSVVGVRNFQTRAASPDGTVEVLT